MFVVIDDARRVLDEVTKNAPRGETSVLREGSHALQSALRDREQILRPGRMRERVRALEHPNPARCLKQADAMARKESTGRSRGAIALRANPFQLPSQAAEAGRRGREPCLVYRAQAVSEAHEARATSGARRSGSEE